MIHPEMARIADIHQAVVTPPAITVNDAFNCHLAQDDSLQCQALTVRDDLRINPPLTLEHAKYRLLQRPPSALQLALAATGVYHQLMAERAVSMGKVVYLLNPRDMRHYALGLGRRGKTDRVDAQMIRRFITAECCHLRPYQPASMAQHQLVLLQHRRATVVKHRQALQKASELVKRHCMMPLFGRMPLSRSDAAVAYVGLDPRASDSGQKRGRRRVSKRGPGELRRLLCNCAQAAAKTAVWKPYYQALRARKFSATQALVIIARKLVASKMQIDKNHRISGRTVRG